MEHLEIYEVWDGDGGVGVTLGSAVEVVPCVRPARATQCVSLS